VLATMLNGGELAALYSFVFLLFVFSGPGALSIDGRKRKVRSGRATALGAGSYVEVPVR
jgi:uncharacterized membrane protein YphA (DoxX/SURF4 family)